MKYIILVTESPYGMQHSVTALLFTKAIFSLNHYVEKIFFYSSGIYNSNCMILPSKNEFNILNSWINLKKKFHLDLCVCPNSSFRRGILSDKVARKNGYSSSIFSSYFDWMNLHELASCIRSCDRVVQF